MNLIAEIKHGNLTLEHSRLRDDFGVLHDSFSIIETKESGLRVHYPIVPPFKVRNIGKDDDVFDATQEYTQDDYLEMLNNFKQ